MMRMTGRAGLVAMSLTLAVAVSACRTTKPAEPTDYDPKAHENAQQLKGTALALVAQSNEPYQRHRTEVEDLNVRISSTGAAAAEKPRDQLVADQWHAMADPAGNLFGGFARRWQTGRISEQARSDYLTRITAAFNYILCLEVAKRSNGTCPVPPELQPAGAAPAADPAGAAPATPPAAG